MGYYKDKVWGIISQIAACVFCVLAIVISNIISFSPTNEMQVVEAEELTEQPVPLANWINENNKVYCEDENGIRCVGIQYIDHAFRYFNEDGSLAVGWTTIGDRKYYFDPQNLGAMLTGETIIDGVKYALLPTGEFISGWYNANGQKYYKNEYGYDEFGFIVDKGKKYYVDENGLKIGKFSLDHDYYTDDNGAIFAGDCVFLGKTSHFSDNGEFIYGWLKDEDGFRYKDENDVWYIGRHTIDGCEYSFDDNGILQVNCTVGMYEADSNGKLKRMPYTVSNLDAALDEILVTTGNDIQKIGEYVKKSHAYRYMNKLDSREEMAVYALNNRYISCYYYEALTGLLLEKAGYEVITIAGKGFVYAEHYWSLVKTTRNGVEGWYHVDSLKSKYIRKDSEMVADGFKWTHENYPATP